MGGWHLVDLLRMKANRSSDRAEGEAFLPCFCHRFEITRKAAASGSDAGMRSVSIKIALSFHPALPLQNSFINILLAYTFDEENPETTR